MYKVEGKILVVDDKESARRLLERIFVERGALVTKACDGLQALECFKHDEFDLVLSDIQMPEMSGLVLLEEIKRRDPDMPVIMVTASNDIHTAKSAIKLGAYDYIIKPFDLSEVIFSVGRALERRRLIEENRQYQRRLEEMVTNSTRELRQALVKLEAAFQENRKAHLESIFVLSKIAEYNDVDTGNHIKRISRYCEELSKAMDLPAKFIEEITYSSPMHDIGKVLVEPAVLKKPGRLTPAEFEEIKKHTIFGAQVLEGVPFLEMARNIALYHHEKYDGSGYPKGLRGEDIPLAARIVAISDVFDALLSKRCYKQEFPVDQVLKLIAKETGSHFDPKVAAVFFRIKDHLLKIRAELEDEQCLSAK